MDSSSFLSSLFTHENAWMTQVFLIILATTAVAMAIRWLLGRLQLQTEKTRTLWDDSALAAADRPLLVLIWILGLNLACVVIAEHSGSALFRYAGELRSLAFIAVLAWFVVRFISGVETRLLDPQSNPSRKVDPTSARAIAKLARISAVVTAFLILLERLGYSVAGVMAFGGIGGIAVGFAAKDLLANFFGGLMIFLDRPFSIGDWIRSPDRSIEGTVEEIGWRQTRIRTFEMRPLYVPNSTFTSISVENPSRMPFRRIKETIGLRYDDRDKLDSILQRINTFLGKHEALNKMEKPDASLDKLNASSLDITITAFTRSRSLDEYTRAKQDILVNVMKILDAEGAALAFPTQTLHLASGNSEKAGQQKAPPARRAL
ncbi:MAG TPA: mechanosensitive ion channel family protein [Moraxellaceae bacterium]